MRIRKPVSGDFPLVLKLARDLGLEYPGLEGDVVQVADEDGRVVGTVGLRRHPDCLELVALGVEENARGRGVGRRLVGALLADTSRDVYLATTSPAYFAGLGFERAGAVPRSLAARMGTSWCEGCSPELCTVMVKRPG